MLNLVTKLKLPAKVIINVSAQILELNNREVAEKWLSIVVNDPEHQAVVFFSNEDDLLVLDRSGHVDLLHISLFLDRLGVCLVYLDEVHTRGTDLRLPYDYRAAVTLGPNLTKDRMVQGKLKTPISSTTADLMSSLYAHEETREGTVYYFLYSR